MYLVYSILEHQYIIRHFNIKVYVINVIIRENTNCSIPDQFHQKDKMELDHIFE